MPEGKPYSYSPDDINQDGVVTDEEYLFGQDQYYEPLPPQGEPAIPFISDDTFLDPMYEPLPAAGAASPIPYISDENFLKYGDWTRDSEYEPLPTGTLEPIPYVSDSEALGYRDTLMPFDDADMEFAMDDELYEPVPTDDELASIQERMDDAEFAMIDEEFTNLPSSEDTVYMQNAEFDDWDDSELTGYSSYQAPQPQQDLSTHRNISEGDWRFRISLSPFADYLYKGNKPGILAPLKATDGVIFPYTPRITMAQESSYESYNPTHSNFRGHWYKGSQQANIIVTGDFTAQDTAEANYMLAMMHFFRSASKMFYGQDQRRGTPPPLLYMTGLGQYQFDEHPVVISMFTYDLPNDVDYVATTNPSLTYNPSGSAKPTANTHSTPLDSILNSSMMRSITSGLNFGAVPTIDNISNYHSLPGGFGNQSGAPLTGTSVKGGTTYVPTKLSIQLTLLPISTREQASNFWSLEDFASGEPLTRGVW